MTEHRTLLERCDAGFAARGCGLVDMPALEKLTGREHEILGYLAAGYTNAAICQELWLSPRTVETHVRSIFCKLRLPAGTHRRVLAALAYWHREAA